MPRSASVKPYAHECNSFAVGGGKVGTTYLCARLRDGTKIFDEVSLGHTDAGIADRKNLVLLVRGDADVEVFAGIQDGRASERRIADFVERVGGVGDDFTKKDILVAVEGVCVRLKHEIFMSLERRYTATY